MIKKYVRIRGRELSYQRGKPKGIFAMCWRMIFDGIFSKEDTINYGQFESIELKLSCNRWELMKDEICVSMHGI